MSNLQEKFFIFLQKYLPKKLLSNLAFYISMTKIKWVKKFFIFKFVKHYSVEISLAKVKDLDSYKNFHDFFTREIDLEKRPLTNNNNIICSPAEGVIAQHGKVTNDTLIQAKGQDISITSLLGGNVELAKSFYNSLYITTYLSPKDYHRIHMPIDGTLCSMTFIPGKLYSVNKLTTEKINNLYTKNERLILIFDTAIGKIALILIGAMLVGSIHTNWGGTIKSNKIRTWSYADKKQTIKYNKGEEIAYFHMGSTTILLTQSERVKINNEICSNIKIKVRADLASII